MAKRRVRDFLPRPQDLLLRLRAIVTGGAFATTSLLLPPAVTTTEAAPPTPWALTTVIVDRSRKAVKLVLRAPGRAIGFVAQHRSHSSHSSHRSHSSHSSHVSGSGGSVYVPPPPAPIPTPAPATPRPAPETLLAEAPAASAVADGQFEGTIESLDREARTVKVKGISPVRIILLYYRDDTTVAKSGRRSRLDEYQNANGGRFPFTVGDKVNVEWKHNAATSKTVVTHLGEAK
jgi:hypothetical protein